MVESNAENHGHNSQELAEYILELTKRGFTIYTSKAVTVDGIFISIVRGDCRYNKLVLLDEFYAPNIDADFVFLHTLKDAVANLENYMERRQIDENN